MKKNLILSLQKIGKLDKNKAIKELAEIIKSVNALSNSVSLKQQSFQDEQSHETNHVGDASNFLLLNSDWRPTAKARIALEESELASQLDRMELAQGNLRAVTRKLEHYETLK